MIISISGSQGSGKSTMAKKLASKLNWPRYYIGALRREAALKRGITLAQYNLLGEKDPKTDMEVDEYQKELGLKNDNFIIEGRTSWYFIPHSFKIYIDVKLEIGAERIWQDLQKDNKRNEDNNLNSLEDVINSLNRREESDTKRYLKYYNFDVHDKSHYDYVIDTSYLSIEEVFFQIYERVKKELKSLDR
jgi:CMP/dCMP kinase